MIPVLSSEQVRMADAHTIATSAGSSLELMEQAATACAARVLSRTRSGVFGDPTQLAFLVVAGMGNNGGDGLVMARLFHASGMLVRVVRVLHREGASADHATNLSRLRDLGIPVVDIHHSNTGDLQVGERDIIIDALVGTGLNSPLDGLLAEVVLLLNRSGRPIVSVDMPSGLMDADNSGVVPDRIIRASWTITFEVPKLSLLLPENGGHVGELEVLPIGLDLEYIRGMDTPYQVLEERDLLSLLPPRARFDHKGTNGHVWLIAGSSGKAGAAVLAARAAVRSGAGLVSVHAPGTVVAALQVSVPEAICSLDPDEHQVTSAPGSIGCTALGIGPGLGTDEGARRVVKRIIQDPPAAMVLDADALNILADEPTWSAFLPAGTILTPHPREFDRLFGSRSSSGYERIQRAREMAYKAHLIIVLKGAWTAVCDPHGQVFFNPTGNPGMAKGGSGDALTGLMTGLLAQRMSPLHAALLGVYLHGLAGDRAAGHKGMDGMTAGDLIASMPEAWMQLRNASEEALQ